MKKLYPGLILILVLVLSIGLYFLSQYLLNTPQILPEELITEPAVDTTPAPIDSLPATTPKACTEKWVCGKWTTCSKEGTTIRSCVDVSKCGTYDTRPLENVTCNYLPIQDTTPFQVSVEVPVGHDVVSPGADLMVFTTISQLIDRPQTPAALEYKVVDPKGKKIIEKTTPLIVTESLSLLETFTIPETTSNGYYTLSVVLNYVDDKATSSKKFMVVGEENLFSTIPSREFYWIAASILVLILFSFLIPRIFTKLRLAVRHNKPGDETIELAKKALALLDKGELDKAHKLAKETKATYEKLSREEKNKLHKEYKSLALEMRQTIKTLKSYHTQRRQSENFKKELYDITKKELQKMKRKKNKK